MSVLTSHAEIVFTEDGDRTCAEAVLDLGGMPFYGLGEARRAPGDPDVPIVREELWPPALSSISRTSCSMRPPLTSRSSATDRPRASGETQGTTLRLPVRRSARARKATLARASRDRDLRRGCRPVIGCGRCRRAGQRPTAG